MAAQEQRVDGRSLRYAGRKQELLKAVTRYVLDNGVGELAMRPMAEAVGVSHVTLLNHFGSKENLITEVIDRLRAQTIPKDAEAPIPTDGARLDGAELLEIWWQTWQKPAYEPAMRLTFEVYGLALQHPDRYEDFFTNVFGAWLGMFQGFVIAAGCPPEQVDATATVLLGQMRGLQMDLLANNHERERINAAHALFVEIVRERQARWADLAAGTPRSLGRGLLPGDLGRSLAVCG